MELQEAVDLFNNKKLLWTQLAPILIKCRPIEQSIMDHRKVGGIIAGYEVLSNELPEALTYAKLPSYEALRYALFFKKKKKLSPAEFKLLISDIATRKISKETIRLRLKIQKSIGRPAVVTEPSAVNKDQVDDLHRAFSSALDVVEVLTKKLIANSNMDSLRKESGTKCQEVSDLLSFIANEEFAEAWKQNKNFTTTFKI